MNFDDLVDKKIKNNKIYYLVKWEGYSHAANTWEPIENLPKDYVDEYEDKNSQKI